MHILCILSWFGPKEFSCCTHLTQGLKSSLLALGRWKCQNRLLPTPSKGSPIWTSQNYRSWGLLGHLGTSRFEHRADEPGGDTRSASAPFDPRCCVRSSWWFSRRTTPPGTSSWLLALESGWVLLETRYLWCRRRNRPQVVQQSSSRLTQKSGSPKTRRII